MSDVKELRRHASPGGRPQPLAFHKNVLWVGCWDTDRLYAIDPPSWKVIDEVAAPGRPYGIAVIGNDLRVVVAIGTDEDRYLFRLVPGQGFDEASKTPCPDFTGSYLTSDGSTLYMTQLGLRRIVVLDDKSAIQREIPLTTRCLGIAFGAAGTFYMIAADEEFENLQLATLDVRSADPKPSPISGLADDARGLAYDGSTWWTSHREASEIVAFTT
jgi:hypothetical protein